MSLQSENIDQIVPALIKARGQFKAAVKDAKNPHFKSAYVTLDGVVDSVTSALLANGVFVTQPTDVVENRTVLHTRFLHSSGQWIGSSYPVHPIKNDPQAEGSALTYARRYSLMALAGIAPEDDDGNAASEASKKQQILPAGKPTDGAWDNIGDEEKEFLNKLATEVADIYNSGDVDAAYDHLSSQNLVAEERIAIWTLFDSKQRSAFKKLAEAAKQTRVAA